MVSFLNVFSMRRKEEAFRYSHYVASLNNAIYYTLPVSNAGWGGGGGAAGKGWVFSFPC